MEVGTAYYAEQNEGASKNLNRTLCEQQQSLWALSNKPWIERYMHLMFTLAALFPGARTQEAINITDREYIKKMQVYFYGMYGHWVKQYSFDYGYIMGVILYEKWDSEKKGFPDESHFGKESTCQCRRPRFSPGLGSPHAQLAHASMTTEAYGPWDL